MPLLPRARKLRGNRAEDKHRIALIISLWHDASVSAIGAVPRGFTEDRLDLDKNP
jgi:hypothetical protein